MSIFENKITRRDFMLWGVRSAAVILAADAFWFEKEFIEFKHNAFTKKAANLQKVRLIQISDLHLQNLSDSLKQAAEKINQLQPDLIVFTGDSIDRSEMVLLFDKFLDLLTQAVPKLAILGNWEYLSHANIPALRQVYQAHHGELLINASHQLAIKGKKILVTGIDSYVGGEPDYATAMARYSKSDLHIFLNHCPAYHDVMLNEMKTGEEIDLALSGHTHGGQINLLGFVPFLPLGSGRYLRGWYNDGKVPLYVSRGIGTSVMPIRLGSRAEIGVFDLTI